MTQEQLNNLLKSQENAIREIQRIAHLHNIQIIMTCYEDVHNAVGEDDEEALAKMTKADFDFIAKDIQDVIMEDCYFSIANDVAYNFKEKRGLN